MSRCHDDSELEIAISLLPQDGRNLKNSWKNFPANANLFRKSVITVRTMCKNVADEQFRLELLSMVKESHLSNSFKQSVNVNFNKKLKSLRYDFSRNLRRT